MATKLFCVKCSFCTVLRVIVVLAIIVLYPVLLRLHYLSIEESRREEFSFLLRILPAGLLISLLAICLLRRAGFEEWLVRFVCVDVSYLVYLFVFRRLDGPGHAVSVGGSLEGVVSLSEVLVVNYIFKYGTLVQLLLVGCKSYYDELRKVSTAILVIVGLLMPSLLESYSVLQVCARRSCNREAPALVIWFNNAFAQLAVLGVMYLLIVMLSKWESRFCEYLSFNRNNYRLVCEKSAVSLSSDLKDLSHEDCGLRIRKWSSSYSADGSSADVRVEGEDVSDVSDGHRGRESEADE